MESYNWFMYHLRYVNYTKIDKCCKPIDGLNPVTEMPLAFAHKNIQLFDDFSFIL